jgi:hypothetical protein
MCSARLVGGARGDGNRRGAAAKDLLVERLRLGLGLGAELPPERRQAELILA